MPGSNDVESRPPPPVFGDCVNRRDVHEAVCGLYISCSYSSYRNATPDDRDEDLDCCCCCCSF